jgi:drug/metabolite transporter (DMT)-like permease
MSLAGIVVLSLRGLVEGGDLPLAAALIPAAMVGKVIGTAALKKISEGAFRAISLGIVIFTGTLGVATAAWALL